MKLKDFKKIRDDYYKKNVIVTTYDGKEYVGKYDSEFREVPIIFIGNEEVNIKDIKSIDYFKDKQVYKYVLVSYDDDYAGRTYSYKTTLSDIKVGDTVLVDRNGNDAYGIVEDISLYTRDTAPYPVEKTKDIIQIVYSDSEPYYDYDEYDDEDIAQDYLNMLLKTMFGRVSIKRLMILIRPLEDNLLNYKLYYYPKFNTFFYKLDDDDYKLAEYGTGLITKEMFRVMVKESIEIPMKEFTSDNDTYKAARLLCEEKGIPYHDDTDILEYCDIKRELSKTKSYEKQEKEFNSLDEIKEFLKHYRKAEWKYPNPSYYIENNRIIHYMGWLDYDLRVFKIWQYVKDNKLVDEKYYNKQEYPEFFEEDWSDYDIEELDYPRLCYLILRMFNIERISEGTVNRFAESGKLLKMIERLETVDKNKVSNKKYKKIEIKGVEIPDFLLNKNEGENND